MIHSTPSSGLHEFTLLYNGAGAIYGVQLDDLRVKGLIGYDIHGGLPGDMPEVTLRLVVEKVAAVEREGEMNERLLK